MKITIEKLADLDRAVAEAAFCPEPPLSERRAIHESGAWRWVDGKAGKAELGSAHAYRLIPAHWEPAPFSTDPAASYALEQRMRESGWEWDLSSRENDGPRWSVTLYRIRVLRSGDHISRLIAMCLAALCALGVELEFREGWDAR